MTNVNPNQWQTAASTTDRFYSSIEDTLDKIDMDEEEIFTLNFLGLLEWLVVNLKFDAFEYLHNYFQFELEQLREEFE